MEIKIKRLHPDANLPTCADSLSAGYDLYAHSPEGRILICPGETIFIGTGIACAIPEGYFGAVYARSGLSCKQGLRPANCVGVIDASYRGEIKIALHNDSNAIRTVCHGDRIAQMVIQAYQPVTWNVTEELDETERDAGAFGSSGR